MAAVMKTSGLAGLLTGAVALGMAELTAAVTGPNGAPVTAVGETAINLTPVPVKEFAIAHFGTHDKAALITGIVLMLPACGVAPAVSRGGWPQRSAAAGRLGRGGRDAGADGARDTGDGPAGNRGPHGRPAGRAHLRRAAED